MNDIAIQISELSKQYRIGMREKYPTIRETMMRAAMKTLRKFQSWASGRNDGSNRGVIWALREVDLEVKQGEVVGIIGPNGAGKSTLLKILTGITEPTTGYADIYGRVGSLLEVGTGFHMELTGRENIFLNGAILGMHRQEIKRKFDEIVAFSEIEDFLDTPVKRYSSGMYMRLAFAVAAHLEPEILLVDEVLAVGDAAFQRKCLGKMGEVAREGRTVLFVSHNMASIVSLCDGVVLLESGSVRCQGNPRDIVGRYLNTVTSLESIPLGKRADRGGDGSARITSVKIEGLDSDRIIRSTSQLKITIGYEGTQRLRRPRFVVSVYDYTETGIFSLDSDSAGGLPDVLPAEGTVKCTTGPINLTAGKCYVNLGLLRGGIQADYVNRATNFNVVSDDFYGTGKMPPRNWVLCLIKNQWSS